MRMGWEFFSSRMFDCRLMNNPPSGKSLRRQHGTVSCMRATGTMEQQLQKLIVFHKFPVGTITHGKQQNEVELRRLLWLPPVDDQVSCRSELEQIFDSLTSVVLYSVMQFKDFIFAECSRRFWWRWTMVTIKLQGVSSCRICTIAYPLLELF